MKICHSCSKENPITSIFCRHCGTKLEIPASSEDSPPEVKVSAESTPSEHPAPIEASSSSSEPPVSSKDSPAPSEPPVSAEDSQLATEPQVQPDPVSVAPPAKVSKSTLFIAAGVICAAVIGVAFIFFTGTDQAWGTPYQRAEMYFLNSIFGDISPAASQQVDFEISYTHSFGDLSALGIFLPPLPNQLGAGVTIAVDGPNSTMMRTVFSMDNFDLPAIELTSDGVTTTIALPEVSRYFLTFATENDAEPFEITPAQELELMAVMGRIAYLYFNMVEEQAVIEQNIPLTRGNVSVNTLRYRINFTQDFLREFLTESIEIIRQSPDTVEVIESLVNMSMAQDPFIGDFVTFDLNSFFDDAQREINQLQGTQAVVQMVVNIADNRIVGREITIMPNYFVFSHTNIAQGGSRFINSRMDIPGERAFAELTFPDLTVTGGLYNGSGTFVLSDPFTFFRADINVENFSSGEFTEGILTFSTNVDGVNVNLVADMSRHQNQQILEMTGSVGTFGFNVDLGNLTMITSVTENVEVVLPLRDPDFAVDIFDYDWDNLDRVDAFLADLRHYVETTEELPFIVQDLLNEIIREIQWMLP